MRESALADLSRWACGSQPQGLAIEGRLCHAAQPPEKGLWRGWAAALYVARLISARALARWGATIPMYPC